MGMKGTKKDMKEEEKKWKSKEERTKKTSNKIFIVKYVLCYMRKYTGYISPFNCLPILL